MRSPGTLAWHPDPDGSGHMIATQNGRPFGRSLTSNPRELTFRMGGGSVPKEVYAIADENYCGKTDLMARPK